MMHPVSLYSCLMFMFIHLISGVKSNQKSYTIHPHPHI